MREYESIFVLDPEVGEERVDLEVDKIRSVITGGDGEITEVQKWGRRKLAYEIKKRKEGIYTLVRFMGTSKELDELNRQYRLNEDLLRHLTVLYEGPMPGEGEGEGEGEGREGAEEGGSAPASTATPPPVAPVAPVAPAASAAPAAPETPAAPATEAPAAEAPAEKAPAEEAPAEEAPTEEASAGDSSDDEAKKDD